MIYIYIYLFILYICIYIYIRIYWYILKMSAVELWIHLGLGCYGIERDVHGCHRDSTNSQNKSKKQREITLW